MWDENEEESRMTSRLVSRTSGWGVVPSVDTGKPEGEQGLCVCACSVILWELGGGPREPQTCVISSCGTFSLLSP